MFIIWVHAYYNSNKIQNNNCNKKCCGYPQWSALISLKHLKINGKVYLRSGNKIILLYNTWFSVRVLEGKLAI